MINFTKTDILYIMYIKKKLCVDFTYIYIHTHIHTCVVFLKIYIIYIYVDLYILMFFTYIKLEDSFLYKI